MFESSLGICDVPKFTDPSYDKDASKQDSQSVEIAILLEACSCLERAVPSQSERHTSRSEMQ